MTMNEQRASGELTRRMMLRNGLMVGLGTAVVAVGSSSFAGRARADTLAPASLANPSTPAPLQSAWGWCNQCAGMFYTSNSNWGVCPRSTQDPVRFFAQTHAFNNNYQSFNYEFYYDAQTSSNWQGAWLWCRLCQGFWYGGANFGGWCPSGSFNGTRVSHDGSGSFPYVIYHGSASAGQGGWYYCNTCMGLFYTSNGSEGGACPAGDGLNTLIPHYVTNSYKNYSVSFRTPELNLGPATNPA
jgi:hypothetical protein